jgi:hypothetical protein
VKLVYRPIVAWPGQLTAERKASPFRADWQDTLRLLDHELEQLGADEAVVQLAVPEGAIRLDGSLRTDRKPPAHPGVILSFEAAEFGPLQYATDVYEPPGWRSQDTGWRQNLRAIALGLEALRKVDRYGISRRGEQYAGWKQLGAGTPMPAGAMTVEQAADFIAGVSMAPDDPTLRPSLIRNAEARANVYRRAAKRLHPDAGGDTELFRRLQEAKAVLDAHA